MDYPKPRKRVTGEYRKQLGGRLLKDYEEGVSIRTLAETTGRSYGFIHRLLGEAGATFRRRGGRNHGKNVSPATVSPVVRPALGRDSIQA